MNFASRPTVALAVATTIALASLTVPAAARADSGSEQAQFNALVAASDRAYTNGVSSRLTVAPAVDSEPGEIYESGVIGPDVYGESPKITSAWSIRDGLVEDAFSIDLDRAVTVRYQPLGVAMSENSLPKNGREILTADVVARGGSLESLVPVQTTLGINTWQTESIAELANPAQAVSGLLDLFTSYTISAGPGGSGPAFEITAEEGRFSPGETWQLGVFASADGIMNKLVIELYEVDRLTATQTLEVTAAGPGLTPPPSVTSRIETPLVEQAIKYQYFSTAMRASLQAAARFAQVQAATANSKVTRPMIKAGLEDSGLLSDASYKVRAIRNGFRVHDKTVEGTDVFGKLCIVIAASGKKVTLRPCGP